MHAVQGSEKLFKGKDFSCTGSFGLFSGETQETACQNGSLLLKLPSLDSMGSQEGLEAEEGGDMGRSALHSRRGGNVQRKGRGMRAHGEKYRNRCVAVRVSKCIPSGQHAAATNALKNSLIQFYK